MGNYGGSYSGRAKGCGFGFIASQAGIAGLWVDGVAFQFGDCGIQAAILNTHNRFGPRTPDKHKDPTSHDVKYPLSSWALEPECEIFIYHILRTI